MSELECLKAEIERQNREFEACFEDLRRFDPDTAIAVSPEWMSELSATTESNPTAKPMWALRA